VPDPESNIVEEQVKLHSTKSWWWLFEVQVTDSECFRLAANQADVTIWTGSSAPYTSEVYEAFPIVAPDLEKQFGELEQITLTISNLTLEIMAYLETNDLAGKQVKVRIVNSNALGDVNNKTNFLIDENYEIIGPITASVDAISVVIGHWSLIRKEVPSDRYHRDRCRHEFKGAWCAFDGTQATSTAVKYGYDLSAVSLTVCDKTYSGPNGCRAHGALEAQNVETEFHPRRFGGMPGIPFGAVL
jgi:phage-related protein